MTWYAPFPSTVPVRLKNWNLLPSLRKLRLLYKSCLVSLALSDLLLGLCYSIIYIPKFVVKYSNAWVCTWFHFSVLLYEVVCVSDYTAWDGICNEFQRNWKMVWPNRGVCPQKLKNHENFRSQLGSSLYSKRVPSEHNPRAFLVW
jgi:hypothetical protein